MKQLLILISWVTVVANCAFAQTDTADLEIWGLPKQTTKASFVSKLNDKKLHVCMADIRPLGYEDANVIGMRTYILSHYVLRLNIILIKKDLKI